MKHSFKFLIVFSLFFGGFAYASGEAKADKKSSGVTGESVSKTLERGPRPRRGRGLNPGRTSPGANRRVAPNRPSPNRRVAPNRPRPNRRIAPSRPNNRRVTPPNRGGNGRVTPPLDVVEMEE